MEQNFMEQEENTLEQAKKIATEIKEGFDTLKEEVKNVLETNPTLYEAVKKFGGISMMIDTGFEFRAFSQGAINANEHIDYLGDYIETNKDLLQIENLKKLSEVFKQRKQDFLEALKTPVTEEEAGTFCESIHENFILKPLDTEPLFG